MHCGCARFAQKIPERGCPHPQRAQKRWAPAGDSRAPPLMTAFDSLFVRRGVISRRVRCAVLRRATRLSATFQLNW
jgi:hypothetical protein